MRGSLPIFIVAAAFCLVATISYMVASRQYEREAALPVQVQVESRPVVAVAPAVQAKAPAPKAPSAIAAAAPAPPSVQVVQADDASQVAEDAAAVGMTTVEPDHPAAAPAEPHALDTSEELPLS